MTVINKMASITKDGLKEIFREILIYTDIGEVGMISLESAKLIPHLINYLEKQKKKAKIAENKERIKMGTKIWDNKKKSEEKERLIEEQKERFKKVLTHNISADNYMHDIYYFKVHIELLEEIRSYDKDYHC
jgi:hypothetical protein